MKNEESAVRVTLHSSFYILHLFKHFPEPWPAYHEGDARDDEGDAEPLAHVEGHALLEVDLPLLEELDEEAEGEGQRQCQAEEEA